ncbi:MAG: VCBS repeat-containing protein [Betaproteobacteria bacterium]
MKIVNSSLEMASSRTATQKLDVNESLRMWTGSTRPDFENRGTPNLPDPVQISEAGKAAQQADAANADPLENDPQMRLLRDLIEWFTGEKIKLFDGRDLQQAMADANNGPAPAGQAAQASRQPAGFGVEYDYHASYSESEQTTFVAHGTVQTADGKAIEFDLSLAMQRSFSEERSASLRLGDAARKKDPLVLNFGGTAAQLTDARFKFDLDSDGKMENINFVTGGSGFLTFDRNHDGKVNNGSELFGPGSGNGFGELAALDDDSNGWIDENDAAYKDLRIWTKDAEGKDILRSLSQANVGAIALAHVGTAFDLKDAANETLGQIRSSGVFLQEDGKAGSIQQIDLTA